jgi:RecA/RadA recombinase
MSLIEQLSKSKLIKNSAMKNETPEFISTGCLTLNLLFSGKMDGGIQIGKVSQIVAPSSLGKSMIGMKVARNAQRRGMEVFYMDTEFAYSENFAESVGIDPDKILVVQNNQIEDVQQIIISSIDEIPKEDRKNLLLIIDSWGGLVTSKTYNDAVAGKDTTDMTVSKKKNSLARLLTGLGCTVFVINQTYETMDQYNPLAVGGGKGIYFASTSIVMGTSKAKTKGDDGEQDGSIISAKAQKSRLSKEGSKLKYLIEYDGGINPYWGILDDALDGEYVVKPSMGWYSRPSVEGDKKWREAEILENAKEFWEPILKKTDFMKYMQDKYSFSGSTIQHLDEDLF